MTGSTLSASGSQSFLQSCRKRLLAFIRKRLPSGHEADDLAQDVLYQYVRINTLMQPVEQAMAWMLKVARNEIIDRSRRKRELRLPDSGEDGGEWMPNDELAGVMFGETTGPEEEYLAKLFWEELEDALSELPPAQREVFEKTELRGYSFRRLSEESGTPVNTLLSRKRGAVLHLRERLREVYAEIVER
ncbi:MAG: sigma-70 family RNA polymerase sigma factor [Desulfovibrio sp.]|jgi:RNA polymerase sigma factor (sigma-70 family)|nr:sigma-70 family RNA polymerase sigma factor [Desulfovibrio sp.]